MRHQVRIVTGADEVLGQRMRSVEKMGRRRNDGLVEEGLQSLGIVFAEHALVGQEGLESMADSQMVWGDVGWQGAVASTSNSIAVYLEALVLVVVIASRLGLERVEACHAG